jgi:[ribosomal protein S5]-alanine N-acetyltransferase
VPRVASKPVRAAAAVSRQPAPGAASRRARIPPVVTPRLILRDFVSEDRVALEQLAREPRLLERVPVPARALAAAERAPARPASRNPLRRRAFELAIVRRRGSKLIGACDLALTAPRHADIGYLLAPRHWGFGYGTEVACALVDFAFRELGLRSLTAVVAVENDDSRRVLTKAGLRWDGMMRRHTRYAGRWHDCHRYVIERRDWNPAGTACAGRSSL